MLKHLTHNISSLIKLSFNTPKSTRGLDALSVAHEGNSLKDHSKISHGVHNPKDLGAAATYSTSVLDCATEDCFQEDQQTREDLRK
jgi:hypothetical protein